MLRGLRVVVVDSLESGENRSNFFCRESCGACRSIVDSSILLEPRDFNGSPRKSATTQNMTGIFVRENPS